MIINTPVSLGELVDKISILHIKNINIKDDEKLKLIREELELLNQTLNKHIKNNDIQNYSNAKIRITKNITDSTGIVYNDEDPILRKEFNNNNNAKPFSTNNKKNTYFKLNTNKVFSNKSEGLKVLFELKETKLKGFHNLQNILAAATIFIADVIFFVEPTELICVLISLRFGILLTYKPFYKFI